ESVVQRACVVERRHHDDGQIGAARIVADPSAGLDAVHFRHDDIEQHDIDARALVGVTTDVEDLEPLPARGRTDDVIIAGGQKRPFREIAGILRVVDYQYPHRHLRDYT